MSIRLTSPNPIPRVSIIGAGNVGSILAQRIIEKDLADVVLLDILEGRPQGIALDIQEAQSIERHDRAILGTNHYEDTAKSDVVVIAAGLARKPGMTRDDLTKLNAAIVRETTHRAITHSPNAVLIVVTNPLDVMTYLAWKTSELPPQRVMGMAGILDSARFQAFLAIELGTSLLDINALVLGGHGDLMVPLPRYSSINGVPVPELLDRPTIERLVERTRWGGAEIVEMLKTGSAYFAPASATCVMVEAILQNQSRLLPVAAYLQGQYGLDDVFIGVPARLGATGIESILELKLTDDEQAALHTSAASIRHSIEQVIKFTEP
ncbi:MAG: malate dehydrogenase [Leptolyngbyaceae cyanobacterium bins.59]|nr:malate dehydrogenase [Leptolyngbyaceae cyanobacterium bins.59]